MLFSTANLYKNLICSSVIFILFPFSHHFAFTVLLRISNIQKHDKATTLTEVREIVDQAIESAESSGGIKKTLGSFLAMRYNENDFLILHENDFDF